MPNFTKAAAVVVTHLAAPPHDVAVLAQLRDGAADAHLAVL